MKESKIVLISGLIIVLLNLIITITQTDGELAKNTGYIFTILSSFCSITGLIYAYKSKKDRKFRLIHSLLLTGMISYFLGESVYAVMDIFMGMNMNEIFPSVPDFFWVIGYIPLFAGMLIVIKHYQGIHDIRMFKDLKNLFLISLVPFLAGFVYIFLMPIIEDSKTTLLAKFVYLFYPIGDLFLISCSFLIFYIAKYSENLSLLLPWKYIASGFIFITCADIVYSYMTWRGTYSASELIDTAWIAGYFLIGAGGFKIAEYSKPA